MEPSGGTTGSEAPGTSGPATGGEAPETSGPATGGEAPEASGPDTSGQALAAGLAAHIERVVGLFRALTQPGGLSITAAATLAMLERNGPSRLTALAAREGVTQPAMTQLITRLADAGLVCREADPEDGRVVRVSITSEGKATLARRRGQRAEKLAGILAQLSPEHRAALAAALPALDALASADPTSKEYD